MRAALENLKRGLDAVGARFAQIVTASRYVTDVSYQDALNLVWAKYFGNAKLKTTTEQVLQMARRKSCNAVIFGMQFCAAGSCRGNRFCELKSEAHLEMKFAKHHMKLSASALLLSLASAMTAHSQEARPFKHVPVPAEQRPPAPRSDSPELRAYEMEVSRRLQRSFMRLRPIANGEAVVIFSITGTGAVTNIRFVKSTGRPALDTRVTDILRSASPFPPQPDGVTRTYRLPVNFVQKQ